MLARFEQALRELLEIVKSRLHGLIFLFVLRQVKDEVEVARARLEHLVAGTELQGFSAALEKVVKVSKSDRMQRFKVFPRFVQYLVDCFIEFVFVCVFLLLNITVVSYCVSKLGIAVDNEVLDCFVFAFV